MEGRRERRGDGQRASGGRGAEGGRSFRPQPLGRSGQASDQAVAPERMPSRNEPEGLELGRSVRAADQAVMVESPGAPRPAAAAGRPGACDQSTGRRSGLVIQRDLRANIRQWIN